MKATELPANRVSRDTGQWLLVENQPLRKCIPILAVKLSLLSCATNLCYRSISSRMNAPLDRTELHKYIINSRLSCIHALTLSHRIVPASEEKLQKCFKGKINMSREMLIINIFAFSLFLSCQCNEVSSLLMPFLLLFCFSSLCISAEERTASFSFSYLAACCSI